MPPKIKGPKVDFKEEDVLQAVVVADSFDNKFHPLTLDKPKILLPFLNVPFIDFVLESLVLSGIQETFLFCCNHASQVKSYLEGSKWKKRTCRMKVNLIISENCHSLGDALRDIDNKDVIRTDFVLLHGDTISNVNLLDAIKTHKERKQQVKNAIMTMLFKEAAIDNPLKKEDNKFLAVQKHDNRIINYRSMEKLGSHYIDLKYITAPVTQMRFDLINSQIYICSPFVLHLMSDNFDYQSIDDLVRGILVNEEVLGNCIYLYTLKYDEYAARVLSFQSYGVVAMDVLDRWTYPLVLDKNITGSPDDRYLLKGLTIYHHVDFSNPHNSKLENNLVVGKGTSIGGNTVISDSVIGKNCKIGNDVLIRGCFIFDNVVIEDGCQLSTCFVANSARICQGVTVPNGCIIGSNVTILSIEKLSYNTRLVDSSMNDTLKPLSENGSSYVYFSKDAGDARESSGAWDWGEVIEDSDSSSFGDSDAEDDDDGNDSKMFYNEVMKNLGRSVAEKISLENVILEINSVKHAYGIQIRELNILLARALLDMPLKSNQNDSSSYITKFTNLMGQFLPLMQHYVKSHESERDVLTSIEEAAETVPEVLKFSPAIVKFFYDEDILSENAILAWWQDESNDRSSALEEKINPLINWLQTAEEDSSEDDD